MDSRRRDTETREQNKRKNKIYNDTFKHTIILFHNTNNSNNEVVMNKIKIKPVLHERNKVPQEISLGIIQVVIEPNGDILFLGEKIGNVYKGATRHYAFSYEGILSE